jgi:hypothetical protein
MVLEEMLNFDVLRTTVFRYLIHAIGVALFAVLLSCAVMCCEKARLYREELNSLRIANAKANCTHELAWHTDHYALKFINDVSGRVVYIYDAEKHAPITKADYEKAFEASRIGGCASSKP